MSRVVFDDRADPAYEFETRLTVSDPALRRKRGVYLTPQPVASYLVRSVERLLQSDFNLPAGLAAEQVTIVDPACGSGVFLREVLRRCAAGTPQRAFPTDSCGPSLLGFDVLPQACEAARQTVAHCGGSSAVRIVEINPLEAGEEEMASLLGVPSGRRDLLVILGNPPWANFGRQNRSRWILDLLADYKQGLAEKKNNLGDDFIKFLRWGQFWLERAGAGVLAFVTSNTYLGGITHRAMRRSLLASFGDLYFFNLHGSSAKGDQAADGSRDENVFDVRSGTALCLLVKQPAVAEVVRLQTTTQIPEFSRIPLQDSGPEFSRIPLQSPRVHYAELRGTREQKLQTLAETDVSTTRWIALAPAAPMFFFVPGRGNASREYQGFPRLDEIFIEYVSGVQTKNDALYTAFSRQELAVRMKTHLAESDVPFSEDCLQPYMTAPFDLRWIYYEPRLLGRARWNVMRHMLRPNVGLIFMRQSTTPGEYDHFLAVRTLVSDRVFHSAHGAPFLAPLYLYGDASRTANLRPEAVERLSQRWRLRFVSDGKGNLCTTFGPDDVLHYVYAVVHGSDYRRRFDNGLRIDFPRVPLTDDPNRLQRLCELGRALVALHVGDAVGVPNRSRHTPCAEANGTRSVPATLPVFRLGGYDVLARWAKQRKGRKIAADEAAYYESLVQIASETMRLRREIDIAADA